MGLSNISEINPTQSLVVFVSSIVLLLFFEVAIDKLWGWAEEHKMAKIFDKLQKQLLELGVISFAIFLFNSFVTSETQESTHTYFVAFEFTHVILLFIGFSFIIEAITLAQYALNSGKVFLAALRTDCEDLLQEYNKLEDDKPSLQHSLFHKLPIYSTLIPDLRTKIEYKIIEKYYTAIHNFPPEVSFAKYLSELFQTYICDLGEVSGLSWLLLILFAVLNFIRINFIDGDVVERACELASGGLARTHLYDPFVNHTAGDDHATTSGGGGGHRVLSSGEVESVEFTCEDYFILSYSSVCEAFLCLFITGVYVASCHYVEALVERSLARDGIDYKVLGRTSYKLSLEKMVEENAIKSQKLSLREQCEKNPALMEVSTDESPEKALSEGRLHCNSADMKAPSLDEKNSSPSPMKRIPTAKDLMASLGSRRASVDGFEGRRGSFQLSAKEKRELLKTTNPDTVISSKRRSLLRENVHSEVASEDLTAETNGHSPAPASLAQSKKHHVAQGGDPTSAHAYLTDTVGNLHRFDTDDSAVAKHFNTIQEKFRKHRMDKEREQHDEALKRGKRSLLQRCRHCLHEIWEHCVGEGEEGHWEDDIEQLFAFGSPWLFFKCVEISIFLQCFYISVWATQLIPMCLLAEKRVEWIVLISFPVVYCFFLVRSLLSKVILLHAVRSLDNDVLGIVYEDAAREHMALQNLRTRIRKKLKEQKVPKKLWKSFIQSKFKESDADGNGQLTEQEFVQFLGDLDIFMPERSFQALWSTVDYDLSGFITWDELFVVVFPELKAAMKVELDVAKKLREAIEKSRANGLHSTAQGPDAWISTLRSIFLRFDNDNSNFLDKSEFREMMTSFGLSLNDKSINMLFATAMLNEDGKMSWEEFLALVDPSKQPQLETLDQIVDDDEKEDDTSLGIKFNQPVVALPRENGVASGSKVHGSNGVKFADSSNDNDEGDWYMWEVYSV